MRSFVEMNDERINNIIEIYIEAYETTKDINKIGVIKCNYIKI